MSAKWWECAEQGLTTNATTHLDPTCVCVTTTQHQQPAPVSCLYKVLIYGDPEGSYLKKNQSEIFIFKVKIFFSEVFGLFDKTDKQWFVKSENQQFCGYLFYTVAYKKMCGFSIFTNKKYLHVIRTFLSFE